MPPNPENFNPWAAMPFHFWSVVYFVFGTIVGSFLNVCIYRMPRDMSIVKPRSHCPHCSYSIPWFLNIPLWTWLMLGGKCKNCSAPISIRYFLVELLTGIAFLGCWLKFGMSSEPQSLLLAAAYCVLLAGFIAATFIDFEHFIIPDEITLGGIGVGFVLSATVPLLHDQKAAVKGMEQSFWGIAIGGGLIFGILQLGKLLFGRRRVPLEPDTRVVFTETAIHLPEEEVPYEELFFWKRDTVRLHAKHVELVDRCYWDVPVRLSPLRLRVGNDEFNPEDVHQMEVVTDGLVLPREAMGLGDVKFMAAIGAFLGWPAVMFSLMVSSIIGSAVGVTLILLGKRDWSSRIPYGPYIALAATIWIFAGPPLVRLVFGR
jgi:leader peptidase (prepilin peptidase)/N-methyltransferase